MKILKIITFTFMAVILTSCIYVPVVNNDAESITCKTFTQSMSLNKLEEYDTNVSTPYLGRCQGRDCAAFVAGALAFSAAITAGSVIISGSIVVTDNTIHWLEYQGTCSDGYLNKTKNLFLNSLKEQR